MGPSAAIPTLVLAAGLGTRFAAAGGQGHKVLATLPDGRPILAATVDCALAAGCGPVTVVVSPDMVAASGLTMLLERHDGPDAVRVIVNPRPAEGIASSLAAGIRSLEPTSAEACVVLLGDQPGIDPTVVRDVVATWRRTGRPTRAQYLDGAAHPVVLPRDLWTALLDAHGGVEQGARALLGSLDVVTVQVGTVAPRDVDVPADLGRTGVGAADTTGRPVRHDR